MKLPHTMRRYISGIIIILLLLYAAARTFIPSVAFPAIG